MGPYELYADESEEELPLKWSDNHLSRLHRNTWGQGKGDRVLREPERNETPDERKVVLDGYYQETFNLDNYQKHTEPASKQSRNGALNQAGQICTVAKSRCNF